MPVDTITVKQGLIQIIDQTLLPTETKYITIDTIEEMWEAIKSLRVRGAPAIGIAAAFGTWLGVRDSEATDFDGFRMDLLKATDYLASSRPTAVNLFWALDRVKQVVQEHQELPIAELKQKIFDTACEMIEEDHAICRTIGELGAKLLKDGDGVLTHCNAGGLATAKYGTALAPIFMAKEEGKKLKVFADETRPLLQGSRLTAWELKEAGIPVTLICDNMAASVMKKGWVQAVIVGTDRVAANGDVANKIGTYGVALLAKAHEIPFYVAAPTSSIDMSLSDGEQIPIEERSADEVTHGFGKQTAPDGVNVYNPAFDVTPHELVTALITEKGVVYPPYRENLKKLFE
ncbi:MAG: S-methyl-5-thioribose-1-phosphate isomerase [bacterium]